MDYPCEIQRISKNVGAQRLHTCERKGINQYYAKSGLDRLIRINYHGAKEVPTGTCQALLRAAGLKREI
jgi:hypothetical protein